MPCSLMIEEEEADALWGIGGHVAKREHYKEGDEGEATDVGLPSPTVAHFLHTLPKLSWIDN